MAISVIAHVGAAGNTTGATTGAIDTTGADLIVSAFPRYAVPGSPVFADSKSNTWTPQTRYSTGSDSTIALLWTVPSSVGSGHTFSTSGTDIYGGPNVLAVSGAHATPYHSENGADGALDSLQTGSVTPPEDGCLIVAAWVTNGNTDFATAFLVDLGFTITNRFNSAATNYAHGLAYLIQGTAGAVNPTGSWTNAALSAAAIAVFRPAAGGGAGGARRRRVLLRAA